MEEFNNKLEVYIDNNVKATVNVLDIIESKVYGKTFIIYTVNNDNETVFASILNESENSYTFEEIKNKDEIDYINSEIDRVVSELEVE